MVREKRPKGPPEPGNEEQEKLLVSGKERLKEKGKGILFICIALVFFIYGSVTMVSFGGIRLLIPGGRGSLGLLVSGPIAWAHYFFYIFFCMWIIAVSTDYLYGEDTKSLRNKISDWSGMAALSFYLLTFMLFHLFGPDGDSIPRYKLFGYYYHLRGPALWNFYLFYVCVTVCIITFLPWKVNYERKEKVFSITWKLLVVLLITTSVLTLYMDKIDAWTSKDRKALMDRGLTYDTAHFEKCIEKNDVECVKLFLSAGMDIDTVLPAGLFTPLSVAVNKGYKDLVQLFLERKANINKRGKKGWAPLQAAAFSSRDSSIGCHDDMVLLLIKNGAEVNGTAGDGHTAVMRAAQIGCPDVVKLLVENKADINAREEYGYTALLYAVKGTRYGSVYDPVKHFKVKVVDKERYDLVSYLLEHGADPNAKSRSGDTPLGVARKGKVQEVVELLEKHHAKE